MNDIFSSHRQILKVLDELQSGHYFSLSWDQDPQIYTAAPASPESADWIKEIQSKYDSLIENKLEILQSCFQIRNFLLVDGYLRSSMVLTMKSENIRQAELYIDTNKNTLLATTKHRLALLNQLSSNLFSWLEYLELYTSSKSIG